MGLIRRLLGRHGIDVERLRRVVAAVPGVSSVDLSVRETGGAGRNLEGEIGVPEHDGPRVLHDALVALADELGPDPLRLAIYVEGVSSAGRLTSADAGLPLNPSSVQLWRHVHGG